MTVVQAANTDLLVLLPERRNAPSRDTVAASIRDRFDRDSAARVIRAFESAQFIDNKWTPSLSARTSQVLDPSTGTVLAQVPDGDAADVDAAVRSAAQAQQAWGRLCLTDRVAHLTHLADLIESNVALLAAVDALDAGLPVLRTVNDILNAVSLTRQWCGLAYSLRGEVVQHHPGLHYTRHAPYGVVARITAYNHPFLFAVRGSVPALLAGNSVVLKPAEQAPMSTRVLGELVRAALPPGVFNIVTGGAAAGESLVTHPQIRRIAFTGSPPVGRAIQAAAARDQVRRVSLELGGKNPMIVFPNADLDAVVTNVGTGMNLRSNQGQSCGSTSRVFLHADVYNQVTQRLTDTLQALTLGAASDPDVDMGPLISRQIYDRVRGYIRTGTEEGASLLTGGLDDPRVPGHGFFVAPTLFGDVPATARIAREEIFGPVISAFRWTEPDEVLAAANAVNYGLAASVWTGDISTALDTAHRLECGYVWVNDTARHYFGSPFGGWKDSGVGVEESTDEYLSYLQVQSVHVKW